MLPGAGRPDREDPSCILGILNWQLILGPGTGRDGEVIDSGIGDPPLALPETISKQSAVRGMSQLMENVDPLTVPTGTTPFINQRTICGGITVPLLFAHVVGMCAVRRRLRRRRRE